MNDIVERPYKVEIKLAPEEEELINAVCDYTGKNKEELLREIILEEARARFDKK